MTATDHFSIWYQSADLVADSTVLQLRLDGIKQTLKKTGKDFWLDVVRLYLGVPTKENANFDKFVEGFRSADANFPTVNNDNIVRCLASITLCFKLEIDNSKFNNLISLAIINANFLGQHEAYDIVPVINFAKRYVTNSAITERDIESDEMIDRLVELKKNLVAEILPDKQMSSTKDTVIEVIDELEYLTLANKTLEEESNILWWIFGEYSEVGKDFFKNIGSTNMVLISAKELSELTVFDHTFKASENILNKVLYLSINEKDNTKETSLFEIVNLISNETKSQILSENDSPLNEMTPCLLAVKKSLEVAKGIDWSSSYASQNFNANIKNLLQTKDLCSQFYREFMYLKNI